VVRDFFGVDRFGFQQFQVPVEDVVKRFCKDLFDVMLLLDFRFFQSERMLERLQRLYPFFGPVVEISPDDDRSAAAVQLRFDLLKLFRKYVYRDKIDRMDIDNMQVLAVGEFMVRDEHAFVGDQADLPPVRQVGNDGGKCDFGRGHNAVEMPKSLDIACHGIGKIIQYRGDLFREFRLLKKQEVGGILVEQGLEAL
jgi:hypothetical protein